MVSTVKRFSGLTGPKKINTVFMFFFLRKGRFGAHFSAQCSLFRYSALLAGKLRSKIAFLVNVVQFYELGIFNRFFQIPIFIGGLDGQNGEHQKRPNFTFLHFSEMSHEIG
jgi:hypothetical protein